MDVKTAISVPDELFRQAEAVARQRKMSRSQLYSTALAEYLSREDDDEITRRLNEVYSRESSELDPAFVHAQMLSLDKDSW